MIRRRTILQAALALACGGPVKAAFSEGRFDDAAAVLKTAVDSGQLEAAALCVRHADTVFEQAFGAAGTPEAPFLLASISKPITVAAVMTLFDQKQFRLEDRVQKFIPEFQGAGRDQMTIQQLLTHNSGLPDQVPENAKLRATHAPLSEFVSKAIRTPLLFAPGTQYSYSSMAILLASEVASRISGLSIADLTDKALYQPLQMQHSAMGIGRLNKDDLIRCQMQQAAPEAGAGAADTKSWDWNSDYWRALGVPWGGAHGSAADVARFLDEFLHPSGRALQPATARLMIQNHNPEGMKARGLGFDLGAGLNGPSSDNTVFGHTGSTGTLCWADSASNAICIVLTTLPGRAANPHPRAIASDKVAKAVR
jgi:CubicO group peptidase (beta-lactamase class C family)